MPRIQTQAVDLTKRPVATPSVATQTTKGLFKIPEIKLADNSSRYVRLLPQPVGSTSNWTETIPYLFVKGFGTFALTPKQVGQLTAISIGLYGESKSKPEVDKLLFRKTNPSGLKLNPKYKQVFLGFEIGLNGKQTGQVQAISLPANRPLSAKEILEGKTANGPVQAGTSLVNAAYDVDFSKKPKYPNLLNLDRGNVVKLATTGSLMGKSYTATIDAEADIPCEDTTNLVTFKEALNYLTDDQFIEAVKSFVGPTLAQYV